MSKVDGPIIGRPKPVAWGPRGGRDFIPSKAVRCPRCRWFRHPVEMIYVPALGTVCAYCVEDARGDKEATG